MATSTEEAMEILAISDLHMDITPDQDTGVLHLSDEEVVAYLTWASQRYAAVVLVGDVFECWRADHSRWKEELASLARSGADGKAFSEWHESMGKPRFEAIEKTYPKTVALIKAGGKLVYVNGNHDACCRINNLIPGAKEYFTLKQGAYSLYFAHGHQADPWCSGRDKAKISISRFLTCCCSVEQELIKVDLDTTALALANTIGLLHDDGSTYRDHATLLAAQNGYDAVVYGHTHKIDLAGLRKKSGANLIYANTGRVCGDAVAHDRIDEVVLKVGASLDVTIQQRYLRSDYLNVLKHITMVDPKKACVAEVINTRTDGIRAQMGLPAVESGDKMAATVIEITSAGRTAPLVPAFNAGVSLPVVEKEKPRVVEPVVVQLSGSVSTVSDEAHSRIVSALGGRKSTL